MKKIISLLAIFLCVSASFAQAPNRMSYQSIIRDVDGALLTEKNVTVQISILKGSRTGDAVYVENHAAATNKNGLISFEIGAGEIVSGQFSKIEWTDGAYYIKTATDPKGGSDFSIVGISEFLSVPYALSARTAENGFSGNYDDLKNKPTRLSQFTNDIGIAASDSDNRGATAGVPANVWSLQGNSASNPFVDKLGTTDYKDLVMVTNNLERLRITKDGDINISNNLSSNDLYVKRNVFLNTVSGATINNGNFTVANNKATNLTGLLDVDRTLNVDGITTLQSALNVNNMAPTSLTGSLLVKKNATFEKNVFVTDTLFAREIDLKRLNVKDNVPDGKYVAVFENTNNGTGDGIKITLGKNATKRGGGFDAIDSGLRVFVGQGFGPDKFSSIKALFDGSIGTADGQFLAEMLVPDTDDALAIAASACRLSEQLSQLIFQQLNSALSLPVTIGPLCVDIGVEDVCVPGFGSAITIVPALPTNLSFGCDVLGSGFQFPTFSFADQSNILDSENSFVEFTDKTGWRMGAVKAQSIDEWAAQYLDPVFLYNLYATFKGLDKSQIFPEIRKTAKEAAESYLQIGVEYSSGNGDYAEWLERVDPNEVISAGDVVAVKGGKITKDLTNAEQVMGISHRPIVLGNVPKAGMNEKGNNVAFMGQIPVKIMGAVRSGDYIVGKSIIPGFGIAVHPEHMTVEDFKLAIGRSWDTNLDAGAKMTNTVVGVHNGDYINILKKMDEKIKFSESRLESVEAKIDALSASLSEVKRNN